MDCGKSWGGLRKTRPNHHYFNMGPESVRKLDIWQDGMRLVRDVYAITRNWPKEEMFGLTSQIRRAAVSIPANISEGIGRRSAAEAARFSRVALGSVYELETLFEIATTLNFIDSAKAEDCTALLGSLARRIANFANYKQRKA